MTISNTKAISIKGEKNHPYSHVIFVLKDKEKPVLDFVAEAEKIMNSKKGTKAEVVVEDGIKKVVIRESKTSNLLFYTSILVVSLSLMTWTIFSMI